MQKNKVDCIIMAAGVGSRLMPLTEDRPKTMVEVKNKPIIGWLLDAIKDIDVNKIFIISNYKESIIKSYIKYNYSDMDIQFIHQKKLSGTADAIKLTKTHTKNRNILVLSGDIIYNKSELNNLIKMKNSLLFTEKFNRLYEYGTIDKGDPLREFGFWEIKFINEKSTRPTSNYVNCGAYYFDNRVYDYIDRTHYDSRFDEKIITNTINLMIDDGIKFNGYWTEHLNEISHPEDIEEVELRL